MKKNKGGMYKIFIAIITMEVKNEGSFNEAFFGGGTPKMELTSSDMVEITEPVLIAPGGLKKIEIIPINTPVVIHGKGIKREVRPPR